MGSENVLLQVSGLTKSYTGSDKALDGASFAIERGEFVSIIGSSGAGKSTLLRCINKLVEPTSGSVVFDGEDITKLTGQAMRHVRRRISMVFQNYNLVHRSTAIENVLQGRLGYKGSVTGALSMFSEQEKQQAYAALEQVGLQDYAYVRADQLSGGQKQRVGIARALVQDPLLILADEPIASLDPKSSRTVMEHLRWAAEQRGIACLVSLHQVEFATEFSDRIIGIVHGRVVFDGTPDELTDDVIAEVYGSNEDDEPEAED